LLRTLIAQQFNCWTIKKDDPEYTTSYGGNFTKKD